ncbi:thiamine pyrophosphate-dependent dehydrogenase E1 component subunit alpha [Rubrobacter taiwanensis]|jgi:2-oxoisovalerate dehydrogenase E1 component alpha subunit|uniref:2-oxoisovalerate dehydrogenase subunit alpha n=1 Tax=Rubrobacter taiwanensis TaxID=185139 RepID=A0A4R1BDD4_9ACTN|nr:thiamine pyrophosphate-dependent dehydrogenase E1 component subunit alpha [Rubrobacter taiwanensis]TCJ15080.1 thiamine pyrophosphate-dependent dehydrogenase E1 component subunit alpha [Rubrobacter taiwanensis]
MAIRETQRRHEALGLDEDDLLRMYRHMLLARRVDERMWILNRQGKAAFVISCQGQEAAQVGAAYNLRPGYDYVYPYYRDAGIVITLGMTARDQLLSLLARAEDPNSGGRQMPGHFSSRELNIVTASAPIGVQYPQAVGSAMAFKMRGEDGVVLACGGEASTSEGDWHEAMNFAGIHDLPVIFLIQNNVYAISVPENLQVAGRIVDRAAGYGFPGVEVDGNDVLAVYKVAKEAFERARRGEGPTLIEAKTYRMTAHSSDDDDRRYREREEVEEWRKKDPILRFKQYLHGAGVLDDAKEREIEEEIRAEVDEATEYAENAPYADPESAMRYVYAEEE